MQSGLCHSFSSTRSDSRSTCRTDSKSTTTRARPSVSIAGPCCGGWQGKDSSVMVSAAGSVWVLRIALARCCLCIMEGRPEALEWRPLSPSLWAHEDGCCLHETVDFHYHPSTLPRLHLYPATSPSSLPRRVHNCLNSKFRLSSLGSKAGFNRSRSIRSRSKLTSSESRSKIVTPYFSVILSSPGEKWQPFSFDWSLCQGLSTLPQLAVS